ncbi:MAG: hypothetical protein B6A08_10690 [Sorangiineae bacterium NIC37A_2]|nr:MAG: hypothetical protein B6A08_10690 [Sorangiineae bacterium NIC37A_2]
MAVRQTTFGGKISAASRVFRGAAGGRAVMGAESGAEFLRCVDDFPFARVLSCRPPANFSEPTRTLKMRVFLRREDETPMPRLRLPDEV